MFQRFIPYLLIMITLLPVLVIADEIKPFHATYELSKYEIKLGIANVSLVKDKGIYTYEKITEPRGLFKMILRDDRAFEKSVFHIKSNKLQSIQYENEIVRRGKLSKETLIFNTDKPTVQVLYKDQEYKLVTPDGTLDRSSMEIALMLNAHKREDLNFYVVDKGKLKQFQFAYLGNKSVETDAGDYQCDEFKVVRSSGKRSTTMCLAESLDFLPVFIEHNEKGTTIQMQLLKLRPLN